MEWLTRNWNGYVRLCLQGYSPERFLNLCNARMFKIWDIRCNRQGDYEFNMTLRDYRRVKPLVRKSRVRLRLIGRFGLPFFVYKHRKRWCFAAGLAAFFLVLYTMTLFIWDIHFEGNYRYTQDTLMKYLNAQNITCGMPKNRVSCEKLEAGIRTAFPEITWVSARVRGTRLFISLKENEVLSYIPKKDESPCDVVAARAGTITSMVVRQGIAQVAVGSQVEEGQILISGRVPVIGDNEEELNAYLVHADGDVEAKTSLSYKKEISLVRPVRIPTGRTRRGVFLKIGSLELTFLFPAEGEADTWDYICDERQLKLFSDFYLPVYMGDIKGRQMVSYEKGYTQKELLALAQRINMQFVEKLREKGVQILENNDRIEKSVSGYCMEGELTVKQSIVSFQPVTKPTTDSEEITTGQ